MCTYLLAYLLSLPFRPNHCIHVHTRSNMLHELSHATAKYATLFVLEGDAIYSVCTWLYSLSDKKKLCTVSYYLAETLHTTFMYNYLLGSYVFKPFGVETLSPLCPSEHSNPMDPPSF